MLASRSRSVKATEAYRKLIQGCDRRARAALGQPCSPGCSQRASWGQLQRGEEVSDGSQAIVLEASTYHYVPTRIPWVSERKPRATGIQE